MAIQSFPMPRFKPQNPRQLHEEFGAAVAEMETASKGWWNGVAAAANGIGLQMSFEWLEGKGCPLQLFYDEDGNAGPRTKILEDQLLPYLQQTNNEAASLLTQTLDIFKEYKGGTGAYGYSEYAEDLRTAQSNLEKVVRGTPQLHERQLNDVSKWMEQKLPYFPQKDGFEFNG